jgi:hypothetical protein
VVKWSLYIVGLHSPYFYLCLFASEFTEFVFQVLALQVRRHSMNEIMRGAKKRVTCKLTLTHISKRARLHGASTRTSSTLIHLCQQEFSEAGVGTPYIYAYTAVILLNVLSPVVLSWRGARKDEGRLEGRLRRGRVTRRVLLVDALCDSFYSIIPLAVMIISFLQIEVDDAYGSWNGTNLDRRIDALEDQDGWNKRDYRACEFIF